MEQTELRSSIECLRSVMVESATVAGSFTHEEVIAVSQQLDELIVAYQKLVLKKPKN
ncbi:Spo0E family sporulation regulatory protein-aspartic acid phosphatase [Brevibacillus sp. H7]|uniref:Spo0E family sporulation regulatory protein-aspartic acid phosphatase n=1 Tax=Brevibacillus sp. H7 TaxID=3349138 RepID=UPI00380D1891